MGRHLDLDGSFEVAARRAAARVEGDEAREDESRHGADGRRDDQAGVVAAAGCLLLGRAARGALGERVAVGLALLREDRAGGIRGLDAGGARSAGAAGQPRALVLLGFIFSERSFKNQGF